MGHWTNFMSTTQNIPNLATLLTNSSLLSRTNVISEISKFTARPKEGATVKDSETRTVSETFKPSSLQSGFSSFELIVPPLEGYNGASSFVRSFSWCLTIFLLTSLLFL